MNEDDLCTFPGFVPPRWHPKRKKRRGKSQLRTARWMKLNEDDLCTFPGFVPPRWHPKRKKRRGKSQLRTST